MFFSFPWANLLWNSTYKCNSNEENVKEGRKLRDAEVPALPMQTPCITQPLDKNAKLMTRPQLHV